MTNPASHEKVEDNQPKNERERGNCEVFGGARTNQCDLRHVRTKRRRGANPAINNAI
jgi:hypothetical protein